MFNLFAGKGTVALAPHIALEELGMAYDLHWIDFSKGEQTTPDYHALNPKGRVPVLAFDQTTLTETPAILKYLSETSGQLMPSDPIARAQVREMMAFLCATMHVNHAHKFRGARWSDDPSAHASMAAKVTQNMRLNAQHLDGCLSDADWFTDQYSIADIYIFTVSRWLDGDGVDMSEFPQLLAHFNRMLARPAVAKVVRAHG